MSYLLNLHTFRVKDKVNLLDVEDEEDEETSRGLKKNSKRTKMKVSYENPLKLLLVIINDF